MEGSAVGRFPNTGLSGPHKAKRQNGAQNIIFKRPLSQVCANHPDPFILSLFPTFPT